MSKIEVSRFDDVYEADLAVAFLNAEGIDAETADRNLGTVDPLMQRALGGLRVMVPTTQAEVARALLKRVSEGEYASDEGDDLPHAEEGRWVAAATLAALFFTGGQGAYAATALKGSLSPARLWGFIVIGVIVGGSFLTLLALWLTGNWEPVY